METIILELIKVGDIALVRGALMFAGAWYIVSAKLTKPISDKLETKFTELRNSIDAQGKALSQLETNHAQQLSLLHQDLGHTKADVQEIKADFKDIKKKIGLRNYSDA